MIASFVLLLGLLLICSLGPGLFFVRRLRWGPLEKLCGGVGLSFVILYGASFLVYALHLPRYCHFIVTGTCLLLTVLCLPDLVRLLRHRAVRQSLKAFSMLFAWGLLLLALVRHYSGGGWAGDWQEHYERALFFLERGPLDTKFLALYSVPARPPFQNLVAAHFLAHTGASYPLFQIVFLFLNLLVFLPLCLMLPLFAKRGRRNLPLLTGFLIANPLLWQNATFTWTKLFTAFYVVLGLWLYLAGWRKRDPVRMAGAFASMSAGFLVHYSAGPYALFLGLHYVLFVFPWRQGRGREALAVGLFSGLLLASWFSWSIAHYGARGTFRSNTTAAELEHSTPGHTAVNIAENTFHSFVPHPLRIRWGDFKETFSQPNRLGLMRDYTFLIYQSNYIFAMGSVGGPLVLYLLVRVLRTPSTAGQAERRFWLMFVVFCTLAGLASHPMPDRFGLAHISGQPLVLLGVAFLAARFLTLPSAARWVGLAGCVVDFALGIFLHFSLQNRIFKFTLVGDNISVPLSENPLSDQALRNHAARVLAQLTFWGDSFAGHAGLVGAAVLLGFSLTMARMIRHVLRPAGRKGITMRRIYHIVPRALWEGAAGPYRPESLATEGFVHCSNEEQVARVANAFFGDQADFLVLCIDADRLTSLLSDEDAGAGERFPHVYGPIDRAAVVEVRPLQRGPDGLWVFP